MSLYTRLVSGCLFPLHERLKGHDTVRARVELERSQWWPAQRLRELQLQRLRELLIEAGQGVPYYRERFAEIGFEPQSLRSLDELRQLPLLDKPLIRANQQRLAHEQAEALGRSSTGGSSGEPMVFGLAKRRVSHDVAAKWRATRWWGVDIGDPEVVVWASPIELGAQDRVRLLRDALFRSTLVPAFEMSEARLDAALALIRQRRPRMLFGYPSALSLLAQHAERRGVELSGQGAKVAFCTGERLYPEQRERIARVFGCAVANGYGGRDAGFIAHECPQGGLHLTAEDLIVELLDPAGLPVPDGEAGEIVVTHLQTRDFPFIRYRTGDIGVLDPAPCACGRGLPLLREVQGRANDFLMAADGTLMQSAALTYVLRELSGIEAFKIIQESLALTRLLLVVQPGFDRELARQRVVDGFRRRLGEGVEIAIEYVDAIPPERSGKYRYIISHVVGQAAGTTGVQA
jgi:phenylacetate-CoA ligase